jgi:hypothetical protein
VTSTFTARSRLPAMNEANSVLKKPSVLSVLSSLITAVLFGLITLFVAGA